VRLLDYGVGGKPVSNGYSTLPATLVPPAGSPV